MTAMAETETETEWEIHPLLKLIPPLTPAAYEALKASIATVGLLEPIWIFEGKVADGRHRLRACGELGVAPAFREWNGQGLLIDFIAAKNLHHRHMNDGQRAVLAARITAEREAEARRRQATSTGGAAPQLVANLPEAEHGRSREQAAVLVGISASTVQLARRLVEHGVPALVEAVQQDAVKVSAAAEVARLDPQEQADLVALGPEAIRARARQIREARAADRPRKPAPVDRAETHGTGESSATVEAELTDEQWLARLPIRASLANRDLFDREALFWRRVQPVLAGLLQAYPDLEAGRARLMPMAFFSDWPTFLSVDELRFVPPPSQWKVCDWCQGAGSEGEGQRCNSCIGNGFEIGRVTPARPGSEKPGAGSSPTARPGDRRRAEPASRPSRPRNARRRGAVPAGEPPAVAPGGG